MKKLISAVLVITGIGAIATAASKIECKSERAFQRDVPDLKSEVTLQFELEANGANSEITNLTGHVYVKSPWENEVAGFNAEDSYKGYFNQAKIQANPSYNPTKYFDYAQFKNINATVTTGREDGMWGNLSLDVSNLGKKFDGVYIFKAGDHMGGTILLSCERLD